MFAPPIGRVALANGAVTSRTGTVEVDGVSGESCADAVDAVAARIDTPTIVHAADFVRDMLIKFGPGIKSLLTPAQIRILPASLVGFLDKRTLQGLRSGTAGGNQFGGGMGGMGRGGGGGGGGGGGRGGN